MGRFVLNCDVVSSHTGSLKNIASQFDDLASIVSGYDFSEATEFDFSSAAKAISKNLQASATKVKNTANLLNCVVDSHTLLQNSMVYTPKSSKSKTN